MADLTGGTTSYPTTLDTASTLVDGAVSGTDVLSAHQNGQNLALIAIETEVGVLPKGSAASLVARLAVGLNNDGTLKISAPAALGTAILPTANGGTGIAYFTAAGPTLARVYTFPDAAATILYSGGALGTPASGVLTNCTGTAAGLTAGTVTINANLTGPITSVGNATSIASQTGTGTKFVMDTSPTLVTPNIGGASATSLTVSGSIGIGTADLTKALHVVGGNANTAFIDNNGTQYTELDYGNNGLIKESTYWDNTNGFFQVAAGLNVKASSVGIGITAPLAQLHTTGTVRFQNFGAGTATFDASGNISSVSDERLKNLRGRFEAGLAAILQIDPILYTYNAESGLEQENVYAGFSAQNVLKAIPEAVGKTGSGYYSLNDRPIIAALVNAVKTLQAEIAELRAAATLPAQTFVKTDYDETRAVKSKANPSEPIDPMMP